MRLFLYVSLEYSKNSINKYNDRSIETSKMIEEYIQLAKDINQEQLRGNEIEINLDGIVFYDWIHMKQYSARYKF